MIGPRFAHAAEPPPTGGRGPRLSQSEPWRHQAVSALGPPPGVRVWLACGRTDMRTGLDGLAMLAQQVLNENPFDGALFAVRGRRGGLVKLLWYDGQGLCLFTKRLDRGHFVWPVTETGRVSLTPAQLSMLLEGIDWRMPKRVNHPELAGCSLKSLRKIHLVRFGAMTHAVAHVHRAFRSARRSGNVTTHLACGAGRDRTASIADPWSATQQVWPPFRKARRRAASARARGPRTIRRRTASRARCRGSPETISPGTISPGAKARARVAAHQTGEAQPWRAARASAAD